LRGQRHLPISYVLVSLLLTVFSTHAMQGYPNLTMDVAQMYPVASLYPLALTKFVVSLSTVFFESEIRKMSETYYEQGPANGVAAVAPHPPFSLLFNRKSTFGLSRAKEKEPARSPAYSALPEVSSTASAATRIIISEGPHLGGDGGGG